MEIVFQSAGIVTGGPAWLSSEDEELDVSLHAEFAYASATELAALIRRRAVSPVELLDAAIERIERRNPSLNAFVYYELRRGARAGAQGGTGS